MWILFACLSSGGFGADPAPPSGERQVAAVVTVYHQNSHADVIVGRLLETHTLDGQGRRSPLRLVSLYTDQIPKTDKSRRLAALHGFTIYPTVEGALTRGTGKLAVDGVLLVAEHGDYPASKTGQTIYPKRRLFDQVAKVLEQSGRAVPIFIDKHVADNWEDAQGIYQTARRLGAPLMAGSSLPVLWRYPPIDVPRGSRLREIVVISYHTLDGYGFHALEMAQCLAERRQGGETGIAKVRCIVGSAVWEAGEQGVYDRALLDAAIARLQHPAYRGQDLQRRVREPVLFVIDHADGLRVRMLTLNGAVGEWSAAWRYAANERIESTLFWTQEDRPFMHFSYLLDGIERMMVTGQPAWPVERTLMTSGVLDALLTSKLQGGREIPTPHLLFSYRTDRSWQQPPPPPPGRPLLDQ